jgi:hypothetical protein
MLDLHIIETFLEDDKHASNGDQSFDELTTGSFANLWVKYCVTGLKPETCRYYRLYS